MTDRYQDKPLIILLENFVLHSIGELREQQYDDLRLMEPRLREIFHREGSWVQLLKAELELPDDLEDKIQALWVRNQERAARAGLEVDPIAFTRAFVDANFRVR